MKVLVTAASPKSTSDPIAQSIYTTLQRHGVYAHHQQPQDVVSVADFDAVIIGSALHNGRWLRPAIDLVERQAPQLRQRKVWLFSSGSIAEPVANRPHSLELANIKAKAAAVEHRIFPSAMGREVLEFAGAAMVAPLLKPADDADDTDQAHRWAAGIVRTLRAESRRSSEGQLTV